MSWLDTWRAFIGTVSPPGQDTQTVGNGIVHGGTRSDPNPTLTSMLAVAGALGVGIEALVEERDA